MKKNIFLSTAFIALGFAAWCQSTATDFEVKDCDGISHHLFSELDAGKVVVISWVMPCAPCLPPTLAAYNAVKVLSNDHPGRISFYLVDDFGDTPCSTLKTWAGVNGLPADNVFSDPAIDMDDYGQYGMPKVVVLGGGANHAIYYNQNNSVTGVKEAIETALAFTSTSETELVNGIALYPNPAQDILQVSYTLNQPTSVSLDVVAMGGALVLEGMPPLRQAAGQHQLKIDISGLNSGIYLLRVRTEDELKTYGFCISR